MKKVRFETPNKCFRLTMEDSECHSPRPFIEKQETSRPELCFEYPRLLPYNPDPVQRYECSNSSPYPMVAKTSIDRACDGSRWPSNDLELSMFDSSNSEPRHPILRNQQKCYVNDPSKILFTKYIDKTLDISPKNPSSNILSSIENTKIARPAKAIGSAEESNFFIKRDNLKIYPGHINSLQNQLNSLSLDMENNPLAKKAELVQTASNNNGAFAKIKQNIIQEPVVQPAIPDECRCNHCVKIIQNPQCTLPKHMTVNNPSTCRINNLVSPLSHCSCMQANLHAKCPCSQHVQPSLNTCNCLKPEVPTNPGLLPPNAVDKKSWMIERYEQNRHDGMEVEKQSSVTKEKREPTVSDLFKIIKLQNEQLQLLQEKVDKFISASTSRTVPPLQNYVTEHVTLESLDSQQHKISIGVMTSFEMLRTSTVFNKEFVTQTNENAQIQCNRSQISIKEVVSKQPATLNFLDGIVPAEKAASVYTINSTPNGNFCDTVQQTDNNIVDDKTLNELSLYNVQVDNATTPLISPEQSLYLDVRDYSESDSGSDDQSNVGWTYYNKVMTHVNGVLQDSDMPSSASALFRNTKQQCVQMQIDKTNVSVTKRVKFGDDPLCIHQPHIYTASTDTSLKMNQLAAKYLKSTALTPTPPLPVMHKPTTMPIEMSFATRNYMERHRILQGNGNALRLPPAGEIPKFLDITALKQQPKLL